MSNLEANPITIDACDLRATMKLTAGKDEIRAYLRGVRLNREHACIDVTDGAMLMRIPCPALAGLDESVTLTLPTPKTLPASATIVRFNGYSVWWENPKTGNRGHMESEIGNASYPSFEPVLRDTHLTQHTQDSEILLDPVKLSALMAAFKVVTYAKQPQVKFEIQSDLNRVKLTDPTRPGVVAYLMKIKPPKKRK